LARPERGRLPRARPPASHRRIALPICALASLAQRVPDGRQTADRRSGPTGRFQTDRLVGFAGYYLAGTRTCQRVIAHGRSGYSGPRAARRPHASSAGGLSMSQLGRARFHAACGLTAALLSSSAAVVAQRDSGPTNDLPNPYQSIEGAFTLPEGRVWGSTSAVEIGKDGRSVWVAERCGANSCVADPPTGKMSPLDPILHYDASGKL